MIIALLRRVIAALSARGFRGGEGAAALFILLLLQGPCSAKVKRCDAMRGFSVGICFISVLVFFPVVAFAVLGERLPPCSLRLAAALRDDPSWGRGRARADSATRRRFDLLLRSGSETELGQQPTANGPVRYNPRCFIIKTPNVSLQGSMYEEYGPENIIAEFNEKNKARNRREGEEEEDKDRYMTDGSGMKKV